MPWNELANSTLLDQQDPADDSEILLPPNSICIHCGEKVTAMREVCLVRHVWNLLKPLEPNADTINVERHLSTQFQLLPPKSEPGMLFSAGYGNILSAGGQGSQDPEPFSSQHSGPAYHSFRSAEQSRSNYQAFLSPHSPRRNPASDTPRTEFFPPDNSSSQEKTAPVEIQKMTEPRTGPMSPIDLPFSPDSVGPRPATQPRTERTASNIWFAPAPVLRSATFPLSPPPEKGWSRWRSKLTAQRKESVGASIDTISLSSTTTEGQRLEEIHLDNLISVPKKSARGKAAKNVSVYLSKTSTYALFWTQQSIHIWDVGMSPPSLRREISTESTCVLAAITKVCLAYIIGTRDQKLTVKYPKGPVAPSRDLYQSCS